MTKPDEAQWLRWPDLATPEGRRLIERGIKWTGMEKFPHFQLLGNREDQPDDLTYVRKQLVEERRISALLLASNDKLRAELRVIQSIAQGVRSTPGAVAPPIVEWDKLPAWAIFAAQDDNTRWHWYMSKPELSDRQRDVWVSRHNEYGIIAPPYEPRGFLGSWKESLVQRPCSKTE